MSKKINLKLLSVILCVSFFTLTTLKSSKFDFRGYYTLYQVIVIPPNLIVEPPLTNPFSEKTQGFIEQHLRMEMTYVPSDIVFGELAYELMPFVIDRTQTLATAVPQIDFFCYRVTDFNQNLHPPSGNADFVLRHNLDRLFFTIYKDFATIKIGRQPISFGSSRIINPTNVLAPIAYGTLGIEQSIGIDAIRFIFPLGFMSDLDTGIVFGKRFRADRGAYFTKLKLNYYQTDFSVLSMIYRENLLFGLDITRAIYGAGVWLESAYTLSKAISSDPRSNENFFRFSTGVDYNFNIGSGLYTALEYHYNGASVNQPENYLTSVNETAYTDSGVYLFARHYLIPRVNYDITSLLNLDFSVLLNLTDGSAYFITTLDYNMRENMYIGIGLLSGLGRRAKLISTGAIQPRSEFGLYPCDIYTYFKFFF